MLISSKIYVCLVQEIANYTDPEAYASDLSLSSIWGDGPDDAIPEERAQALMELHRIASMTVREMAKAAGLSQRAVANRFFIPQRTVESWCASPGSPSGRECPMYTRLMMAECLGLLPFSVS